MQDDEIFSKLLMTVGQYWRESRSGRFVEYHDPVDLAGLLALGRTEGQQDWQELFDWAGKYLRYAVKTNHPGFVNRMWSGASLPTIVGEVVAAVSNTSACTYETAPVSTLLERYMIERMLEIVGFSGGQGQMTTGSSNANMIAMMCARNLHDPAARLDGVEKGGLAAFVSADSHYSMDRAANILGIGLNQLGKVPVDGHGRMDVQALQVMMEEAVKYGRRPFFVAVTAGTTVRGAFDPIEPLVALRSKYGFWLHVDGAWGGAVVLSERLRGVFLRNLELADSFTMDFHKMLGSSLMCNVLLLNRKDDLLRQVLSAGDGSYLFREEDGEQQLDFGPSSLQCGRRVDSLKWFLDWKFYGQAGLASRVEKFYDLCCHAEKCVERHPELELMAPRESFNICFRYRRPEVEANHFNLALRNRLYQRGISMVGCAYIDGQLVLRLLITNVLWDADDVERYFENLVAVGRQLSVERMTSD
jgi:glutamate/tyrosine decarboxylase-like PLP-dependent enzyme